MATIEDIIEHHIAIFAPNRETEPIIEMKSNNTSVSFSKGDFIKGTPVGTLVIERISNYISQNEEGYSVLKIIHTKHA